MLERIGDDGHAEGAFIRVHHRKAHPVQGDRAFGDDEAVVGFFELESEVPTPFHAFDALTDRCGIDVALDDMAIEAAVGGHSSFQVHFVPGIQASDAALMEGLRDGADAEAGLVLFLHREAHAVHRDALIDLKFRGKVAFDADAKVLPFLVHLPDPAHFLDDPCEHVQGLRWGSPRRIWTWPVRSTTLIPLKRIVWTLHT